MSQPPEKIGDGVFVSRAPIVTVGPAETAFLLRQLADAARRRVRLCAHGDAGEPLHEMFILLDRTTYIRPHRHPGKPESLLVLEGDADAVFLDEAGGIAEVIPLGDPGSGRTFFYRIQTPVWHTLLIRSERLLFHEATLGPFRKEQTEFAPFAPAEEDRASARLYCDGLDAAVRKFRAR